MAVQDFFDLRVATVAPGEAAPPDAHWIRIPDPPDALARRLAQEGWFYKPCYVTWVLRVPDSLDAYVLQSFRAGTRNKPRKLLRDVPLRYAWAVDDAGAGFDAFVDLYRRTIVARPRGRDRVSEHHPEGFDPREWTGFYARDGGRLVAGLLVHRMRDHLSVAYGAFDPAHRDLDLEHFLIMKVIERCAERRVPWLSLGMDTNRYGHHLPLGLPAYKLRIGFTPLPWEPAGRELARVQRFDVFEDGLFFFSYAAPALAGNLFTRGEPDLRPFRHHNAPPVRTFPVPV